MGKGYGMRLILTLLVTLSLSGCSLIPESWNLYRSPLLFEVQMDRVETESQESPKKIVLQLVTERFAKVELGQSKVEVLEILGPSVNLDSSKILSNLHKKNGDSHEMLYFRTRVDGVEDIRALLFKADKLVGIGWSAVN